MSVQQWFEQKVYSLVVTIRLGLRRDYDMVSLDSVMPSDCDVAFMHIPKTSGSALLVALSTALDTVVRHAGFDRSQFGAWDGVSTLPRELQTLIWPEAKVDFCQAQLILGHISYTSIRQNFPYSKLMTVVREPVSRLISLWFYWRRTDPAHLTAWGTWGDVVRLSYQSLGFFLSAKAAACHTDNVVVRMLLWPDDRIPAGSFIDPENDDDLVDAALNRLIEFDFLGAMEDPTLEQRLQRWLGRYLVIPRVNETTWMPLELRSSLTNELTPEVCECLNYRSRLDLRLWEKTIELTMPGIDAAELREQSIVNNVARYHNIMMK